jgi:hypothetical protein
MSRSTIRPLPAPGEPSPVPECGDSEVGIQRGASMERLWRALAAGFLLILILAGDMCAQPPAGGPAPEEGDYVARDFPFRSGETLPELRLHYTTLGKPARDRGGRVSNAVLILHGTGGSGRQFLVPQFAAVLFGRGQLLDAGHYFIILPDNVGHGRSSKPSDGMHARFPLYEYDDMVAAQHELLEKGRGSIICASSWVLPWVACTPGCGRKPTPISWMR